MRNALVETFNGRLRDEYLNEHVFGNLAEARKVIEIWRIDYNIERPQTSLGGLAPTVYANLNPPPDLPRLSSARGTLSRP